MPISTSIQSIDDAKAAGATALFGEKYSDEVRVISIDDYSKELCGGTHTSATGDIGIFKIVSEGSTAAGIRRIEAVTGRAALDYISQMQTSLQRASELLSCPPNMIEQKLQAQKQHISDLESRIKQLEAERSLGMIDDMLKQAIAYEGFKLLITELPEGSDLKAFSENLRSKLSDEIAVIFCAKADKLSILTVVGKDLLPKYNAGRIVSAIAAKLGGKGGGRPDSAQAGCSHPGELGQLKLEIPQVIQSTQ
jgi:alanyl-tRNA synthetase